MSKADGDDSAPTTPAKPGSGKAGENAGNASGSKPNSKPGRKRKRSTPLSDSEHSDSFQLEDTPPPKKVKSEHRATDKTACENAHAEDTDGADGYLA